jgi:hypothetical protein
MLSMLSRKIKNPTHSKGFYIHCGIRRHFFELFYYGFNQTKRTNKINSYCLIKRIDFTWPFEIAFII